MVVGLFLGDLRINKIPIFEREGWQSQPSLSKIGILFSCKSLGKYRAIPCQQFIADLANLYRRWAH